jgi:lipoprotein-releasing system ATP-binding protein
MLSARSIHKYYGSLHVLKGIDMDIKKGELVSIVGASGAGKSTLLHILGTLDLPDQGELKINNIAVMNMPEEDIAQFRNRHIGFIFQFHNLLPEFTAFENVCIPGFLGKRDKKEVESKAEELLNILGVLHRRSHKPSELSGGEQQRVAVARALVNSPSLVLADEPTGNLDSHNAEELHKLFFKLRESLNQTFVIVTHNERLANMADRKLVMADGKISTT